MKKICFLLAAAVLINVAACKKDAPGNTSTGTGTGNKPVDNGKALPNGAVDGVTFINSGKSVIFNLYAPNKTSVSVTGDFNNWQATKMTPTPDGTRWWVQVDNIDADKEYAYQYLINGSLKVADPYTEKVLDPDNDKDIKPNIYPNLKPYPTGQSGIVSVFQANQPAYTWKASSFKRPDPKNLVVYELLVRDFVATHTYKTLTDTLNYLVNLGVNAVELLPVNEFEGNSSWGYNTNFGFALDKYYGTKNDYKAFIDACHAKGIAVIQDIVLEDQFGSSPMVKMYATSSGSPASNNPWFDMQNMHPDAVGYQLNHQSAATKYYTKNVMKYWMQEYHIDGFRFDQAKGFTQTQSADEGTWANYDASRVAIWKDYNNYMKTLDPNFYVILEYFAADNEETALANEGMIIWNNVSTAGQQSTMGYATDPSWDISRLFYQTHNFTAPYNLVGYFESHDEERTMYKNEQYGNAAGGYNVKDIATGLQREEMASAFLLAPPGPKMIWQFEELGYDKTIDLNGRTGEKPILWDYNNDPKRRHLYATYAHIIKWKINNPVFTSTSVKYNLGGSVKSIQLLDNTNNVEIFGNFDVTTETGYIDFPATGAWYDNITGNSINVTSLPYQAALAPGEYHIYSTKPLSN